MNIFLNKKDCYRSVKIGVPTLTRPIYIYEKGREALHLRQVFSWNKVWTLEKKKIEYETISRITRIREIERKVGLQWK